MSIMDFFKKGNSQERALGKLNDNALIQPALCITKDFALACLVNDLEAIVDDVLQPYIFGEDVIMDNVYPFGLRGLYQGSRSVRDVLINAMLANDFAVNKISLKSRLTDRYALFFGDPGQIEKEMREIYGEKAEIAKSVWFEKIYSEEDLALLLLCYQFLAYAYNRQDKLNKVDAKLILRMKGFHAIFTQPKNAEEEETAKENRKRMIDNFEEIINGVGGIIDAEDSLGLVGGVSSAGTNLQDTIDMVYQEIARILRVPLTRLLGRAPQGMNATGESDRLNYDMTLDGIRSGWLEPMLKCLEIEYKKVDKIDIDYIKQVVEMMILTDIEVPEELKKKIVALGVEL